MTTLFIPILLFTILFEANTIAGSINGQDEFISLKTQHNQPFKDDDIRYEMNLDKHSIKFSQFDHKVERRSLRKRKDFSLDSITIDNIEIKINWEDFLKGKRIGSAFTLKKNRRFIENALLYSPKDGVFTVRGLLDATSYLGEVKIIKDKKKFDNSSQDSVQFKINTPRIVSGMSVLVRE
jgi:hypothetical protein